MIKLDKKTYEVEPDEFFEAYHFAGYDGYDIMEIAEKRGWHVLASWGKDGYDLGSWPYVVVYTRKRLSEYLVALYVEGDMTQYLVPDIEIRNAIIDDIAFFYWKQRDEEWVRGYTSVDELPPQLRGPYR